MYLLLQLIESSFISCAHHIISVAYYKRNMHYYNLGINNISKDKGFFYIWNELYGKRGSKEVAVYSTKHFETFPTTIKRIVMFSDTCTRQNCNIKISLSILKFVSSRNNSIEIINYKFLVSDHSYLPNDSNFASVENSAENRTIYVSNNGTI